MRVGGKCYRTVWMRGASVYAINQNKLPFKFEIVCFKNAEETARAISDMTIRGAGAVGAAAGFAIAQGFLEAPKTRFFDYVLRVRKRVEATRPTARNLFYATARVFKAGKAAAFSTGSARKARQAAAREAQAIADEDAAASRRIGELGARFVKNGARVLTHCNAGWLAFVDWGTALAPVYIARERGKKVFVFVDETRPRGQGARLTAWELRHQGIPHKIIADNAAAFLMSRKKIDLVLVGADRIAANGDTANKIGTLEKAVCAHFYGIPFYVAAPCATFDLKLASGARIPIEYRSEKEVLYQTGLSKRGKVEEFLVAAPGSRAENPAFDVTPARLVTAIITEKGIIRRPDARKIRAFFKLPKP